MVLKRILKLFAFTYLIYSHIWLNLFLFIYLFYFILYLTPVVGPELVASLATPQNWQKKNLEISFFMRVSLSKRTK
jgi:hypothetical protein